MCRSASPTARLENGEIVFEVICESCGTRVEVGRQLYLFEPRASSYPEDSERV